MARRSFPTPAMAEGSERPPGDPILGDSIEEQANRKSLGRDPAQEEMLEAPPIKLESTEADGLGLRLGLVGHHSGLRSQDSDDLLSATDDESAVEEPELDAASEHRMELIDNIVKDLCVSLDTKISLQREHQKHPGVVEVPSATGTRSETKLKEAAMGGMEVKKMARKKRSGKATVRNFAWRAPRLFRRAQSRSQQDSVGQASGQGSLEPLSQLGQPIPIASASGAPSPRASTPGAPVAPSPYQPRPVSMAMAPAFGPTAAAAPALARSRPPPLSAPPPAPVSPVPPPAPRLREARAGAPGRHSATQPLRIASEAAAPPPPPQAAQGQASGATALFHSPSGVLQSISGRTRGMPLARLASQPATQPEPLLQEVQPDLQSAPVRSEEYRPQFFPRVPNMAGLDLKPTGHPLFQTGGQRMGVEEDDEEEEEEKNEILPPTTREAAEIVGQGSPAEPPTGIHEGDHDGRRRKAKRRAFGDKVAGSGKKFACPYFKRNPRKYSKWTSCPGPGWDEVHRVKTHLYRRHALPLQCPRCWSVFKSDTLMRAHLQQDPPCDVQPNATLLEGFTKDQEKKLRSRKKTQADMTDDDKWKEIYTILFPDDDQNVTPSPYYETRDDGDDEVPPLSEFENYAAFVRREMPTLVRRELEILFQDEFQEIEERLRPKVAEIVLKLQPRLLQLYNQSSAELQQSEASSRSPQVPGYSEVSATPDTSASNTGSDSVVNMSAQLSDWPDWQPVWPSDPGSSTTGTDGDFSWEAEFDSLLNPFSEFAPVQLPGATDTDYVQPTYQ